MRTLVAVALAAATLGVAAPSSSATRCSADVVTCTIRCVRAQLDGGIC
ncbi:MAG TPA: hypothetical protein VGX28_14835 [Frankiaceae bacterium]|nr:hypothetical protein [Frankiaceae bacterium]